MATEAGGFLVPQEFMRGLKLSIMKTVLIRTVPNFALPQLREYIVLKDRIDALPKLWRTHLFDYSKDMFTPSNCLPWHVRYALKKILCFIAASIYGKLQEQWAVVSSLQQQLEEEAAIKAWADLGLSDDTLTVYREWLEVINDD